MTFLGCFLKIGRKRGREGGREAGQEGGTVTLGCNLLRNGDILNQKLL